MFWHNTSILNSSLNNKCDLMVVTVKFWVLKAKNIATLKRSNEASDSENAWCACK